MAPSITPYPKILHQLHRKKSAQQILVESSSAEDLIDWELTGMEEIRPGLKKEVFVRREQFVTTPPPEWMTSALPGGTDVKDDPSGQTVVVRGEEIGIVLVVLILWVGAIVLFFNRWGKIRMLEPYQPKFCEHHNPNCPMADPIPPVYPVVRTFSKFNLSSDSSPHFSKCNYHGVTTTVEGNGNEFVSGGMGYPGSLTLQLGGLSPSLMRGQNRLRQNSVFVTSPNTSNMNIFEGTSDFKNTSRKTKSAVDLSTLVLSGEFMDNVRRNSKNSITNL